MSPVDGKIKTGTLKKPKYLKEIPVPSSEAAAF